MHRVLASDHSPVSFAEEGKGGLRLEAFGKALLDAFHDPDRAEILPGPEQVSDLSFVELVGLGPSDGDDHFIGFGEQPNPFPLVVRDHIGSSNHAFELPRMGGSEAELPSPQKEEPARADSRGLSAAHGRCRRG